MILSHANTEFPYRRQLLTWGVGLCALLSPAFPAENTLLRVVAPFVVVLIAAMAYGFMWLALSMHNKMWPRIAFYFCLLFYYVGLYGAFLIPFMWWYDASHVDASNPGMSELNPMAQMASCWATAAAAYVVLRGDTPHGKVPIRGRAS